LGADQVHDRVVARAGGGDDADPGHRLDVPRLALDHEDDVQRTGQLRQALLGHVDEVVAQAGGGAGAVAPPAVRDGADDVGRVHDQERVRHRPMLSANPHETVVPRWHHGVVHWGTDMNTQGDIVMIRRARRTTDDTWNGSATAK
jgi:hypothetical protein